MNPKIIVAHYHLFKNAGTSVDLVLEQNFGAAWQKIEFKKIKQRYNSQRAKSLRNAGAHASSSRQQSNSRLVRDWLIKNQSLSAFSSHTAMFPLPEITGISLIPIVFLRHPIDRLWSVYKFERQHKKILNESIKLAQEYDFAGYLNYLLDQPHNRSCRNFQTYRFSWLTGEHRSPQAPSFYGGVTVTSNQKLTELEQALKGLAQIPIVGIVEKFDLSMRLYQDAIAQYYPSFKFNPVHKNVTSKRNATLAEKLDLVCSNLDSATYQRLLEANQDDLELYEAAKSKLLSQVAIKVEV